MTTKELNTFKRISKENDVLYRFLSHTAKLSITHSPIPEKSVKPCPLYPPKYIFFESSEKPKRSETTEEQMHQKTESWGAAGAEGRRLPPSAPTCSKIQWL